MSLAPSTDLVLEVARAADPARATAVMEKLNALGKQGAGSPQDFASALNAAAPAPARTAAAPPPTRGQTAQTKLESVMLSEFIGEMLPKDAPDAYGQGYAGDMWRSMLAERVADQIAKSGRLGLASRLFAGHPLSSSARPLAAAAQMQTAQAGAPLLSSVSGSEIRDSADPFADAGAP